jgi:hypothetical protein
MKLQKETWLVVATVSFLLSWLIDRLAGPVIIVIGNPITFLKSPILLHTYPFTATAIIVRAIALFISAMLITTIIERKYFTKAIVLFFIGTLGEFFAIQQLATGFRVTTIQWTLSVAYASLILTIGIIWMTLMGIWTAFNQKETVQKPKEESGEESILTPKN